MNVTNLTSGQLRQAAELKEKIASLEAELSQLLGGAKAPAVVVAAKKQKHKMSAAGKARIVAAQKARWAKIKAAKK